MTRRKHLQQQQHPLPSQPPVDILDLWFPHITQPPGVFFIFYYYFCIVVSLPIPGAKRGWTSAEIEALNLYNHRQLVPSDYEALNAILSTVAHINTGRDYTTALSPH